MKARANWKTIALALCLACVAVHAAADDAAAPVANPFDIVTNPSGLQYRELVLGTGPAAMPGNTISVHYTGWLQNPDGSRGTKFDSSRDAGRPLGLVLGNHEVIRGWEEGLQGMKVGGKRRLIIPSVLAYGTKGTPTGSVPPNSTLIFDVELVDVK
jgi:FKBP-type peptidyl-prolyl cis-trans isomerase FkpA